MPLKLAISHPDESCEGKGEGKIIHLPVLPKLHAIQGGRSGHEASKGEKSPTTNHHDKRTPQPYQRVNLGIGNHDAQRPWEIENIVRAEMRSVLPNDIHFGIHHHDEHLAGSTTINRPDGITMIAALTHGALAKMRQERLYVPTDIPEDAY